MAFKPLPLFAKYARDAIELAKLIHVIAAEKEFDNVVWQMVEKKVAVPRAKRLDTTSPTI